LFKKATVTVTVSDGKLTVDAAGGSNTKINYLIIEAIDEGEGKDTTPPSVPTGLRMFVE